jgi:hypothetical protein
MISKAIMTRKRKIATSAVVIAAVLATVITIVVKRGHRPVVLRGAVLREDHDPNLQLPLANVQITASNELGRGTSVSNPAGFFSLTLPKGLRRSEPVTLRFQRTGYRDLVWNDYISDKLYVARMIPVHQETVAESHSDVTVSNVRIRYSVKATTEADIGSLVRTFQVVNTGNVPCKNQPPCAPGGKWKAVLGSYSLDAGEGNEFRNARVSCIAGPCPFTKIELEDFSEDQRRFNVTVRNWSDTTTYLLEAEVVHPMTSDLIRDTYPVLFGRALNFSLPASAEGPSIEAEVNGSAIVFPLGPDLLLRWADCHMDIDKDGSRNYRCELKSGFRFH